MNWETRVTKMLGISYPIIQGGLAYLAYSDLAAAVSNAGGLGQITAMSLDSPEELKKEIRLTREKTRKPFAVNFAIGQHGRPFEHMLQAAIEEGITIVSVTGGNPSPFFNQLKGKAIKKLVLVASKRQAVKAEELGADAVMAVGHEGGGHLGKDDTGTMVLIPAVCDAVSIPVIASGGIGDGRGLMAALALGAEGIEMGTRFIAVKECVHAHQLYKDALLAGNERSTVVIKKSLGAPARAIANDWTNMILNVESTNGGYEKLKNYISGTANKQYIYEGRLQEGFAWAGQVMGLISNTPSTEEMIQQLINDAEKIRHKWM
ncbi:nitronate monooxygenase [Bacillus lacus]|uniref:Probable nitronate monooxygenase n=1 Tax=Metabacillus lacus TaxID=1983721 RepID=A0A7X2IXL5_9BACI|nr:nitronate monooxygenase [Metabacillus lacus]MRX71670.1 nitronate monooxygenase [Metabacillus lacus]